MQTYMMRFWGWWKRYAAGCLCLFLLTGGMIWQILSPDTEISVDERRRLAQVPQLSWRTVFNGEFTQKAEAYLQDQFPGRQDIRRLKAWTWYRVLRMKDYEGIYVAEGYAAKLDEPLSESSILRLTGKIEELKEKYFPDSDIYLAVIPLKNYFLAAKGGYPALDYEKMLALLEENADGVEVVDLAPYLEISDYYRTDIHWRQEQITGVAAALLSRMHVREDSDFSDMERHVIPGFYGSYYGQAALPMASEEMTYLSNEATDQAVVWHLESGRETGVYDLDKLEDEKSVDKYDIYLSGADALQVITNPAAQTQRELIVFRDSFGSSLIPLLLSEYSKITMIDLRYIASGLLGNYVDFAGENKTSGESPDVLFLYNTDLINQSAMLK